MENSKIHNEKNAQIKFGFLSTIDSPLLPFLLSSVVNSGITNICVICDSKVLSDKDKKIWNERTGGAFEKMYKDDAIMRSLAKYHIPYYFVENHNDQDALNFIRFSNVECLFNAGTPRKLSMELISSVKHGVVNIHPGLLPNYRGCSAVEWAILNNDRVGNTAHFMSEGYDTGPIIKSEWYEFPVNADYQAIRLRVHREACNLAGKVLSDIQKYGITPNQAIIQDERCAKYWDPIPDEQFNMVIEKVASGSYKYQSI